MIDCIFCVDKSIYYNEKGGKIDSQEFLLDRMRLDFIQSH